jgi:hypothetical protein
VYGSRYYNLSKWVQGYDDGSRIAEVLLSAVYFLDKDISKR